jgi:mono/diheme cytochrome c family protein
LETSRCASITTPLPPFPGFERIGYAHVPHPDDSFCPFFRRPRQWPHSHHVHVVRAGDAEERRTLAFRDYLRAHPETARVCAVETAAGQRCSGCVYPLSSAAVNVLIRVAVALCLVAVAIPVAAQELQVLRLGDAMYEANCAPCHGQVYDPGGPLGPEAGAIPAYYTGGGYLLRVSRLNLQAAILLGVPGSGMTPLGGSISDEQLDALIAYIEWFRDRGPLRPW